MSRRKKERRALARAAAAAAGANGGREPGRFSARRKTETILRLLRGESLDTLARELGVTAATLGAVAGSVLRRRASGAEEPTRRRMGRRDPAAPSQGRRDHDEQRVATRAVPPVGGQPAFTAAEAERMSQTCSPSTQPAMVWPGCVGCGSWRGRRCTWTRPGARGPWRYPGSAGRSRGGATERGW